jgi:hypothetical protein
LRTKSDNRESGRLITFWRLLSQKCQIEIPNWNTCNGK